MYYCEIYLTFLILVSYFNIFNIYFWVWSAEFPSAITPVSHMIIQKSF